MRICWMVEWHGATKFKISWQLSVAGTANKQSIFDTPSTISVRSLQQQQIIHINLNKN